MHYALNNLATKILKIIITSEAKKSCYSLLATKKSKIIITSEAKKSCYSLFATKKSKINGRIKTTYLNYC